MAQNKGPYKDHHFRLYVEWKKLPPIYRGMSGETLERIGVDEFTSDLLRIKTQKQFAQFYNIDPGTLSEWNKRIEEKDLVQPFFSKTLRKVVDNGLAALGANQLQKPNPTALKFLFEIVYGKDRPVVYPPKVEEEIEDKDRPGLFPPDVWEKMMHTLDVSYSDEALAQYEQEERERVERSREVEAKKFEFSPRVQELIRKAKQDL